MTEAQKIILPENLICFDDYVDKYPLLVDLVYAQATHQNNIFKTAIYHPAAKCWGHRDMVLLTLRAAEICYQKSGFLFEIKDCLRPVEAQAAMMETDIVKAHPQWVSEPDRLLSPPGVGGHPRGMAVDIILKNQQGEKLDMGTEFDYLTADFSKNPAARDYAHRAEILKNRSLLDQSMAQAAAEYKKELLPLPQEWWDFRFPHCYSKFYQAINDQDLPQEYQMMSLPS